MEEDVRDALKASPIPALRRPPDLSRYFACSLALAVDKVCAAEGREREGGKEGRAAADRQREGGGGGDE